MVIVSGNYTGNKLGYSGLSKHDLQVLNTAVAQRGIRISIIPLLDVEPGTAQVSILDIPCRIDEETLDRLLCEAIAATSETVFVHIPKTCWNMLGKFLKATEYYHRIELLASNLGTIEGWNEFLVQAELCLAELPADE
ncbi:hypothetical protein A3K34_04135 [candidate division WWE3 bacterium RIFOXYC1_FULL_40_10]|uniref:Uncharacterized protein n=1 Tax=candidate division WWE3 bacterium RIFOXYA2_FULL_46_9 TaxID=1802636 RepID=A0A1F4W0H7_UNCKA|nr:MAG: hypothetical protein A3K58_04135 [candidate division WWE3 bacterium RIFOXYB1_FULL_40_22]OGC62030.1 MAG: hypothetical protein A3K37_04135 [candidate division WWE3 bacterium RIFOXYA1_FULL_40_11]OGC62947.1 MAG: hypothetical protein A2264_03650 [candidate division WWE3 bacterium RIFOXYA2_FULL_46_9]OGC65026.1 MAG: hypothetical protein A2326_03235 [candidate division WWE3 bacterium RIFOXYB2_FULL_41_6]OGC66413.1 MAG: hypothetical protein A3K34_04135 [candidate division WWE3 bacterium RIFOXYC1_